MQKTIDKLIKFRNDRGWHDYHTEERLANSVHLEAGELAQLFQWGKSPRPERVKEEIADTAIYLIYLCEKYGFDFRSIIDEKIRKNAKKYDTGINPVDYGWSLRQK